MEMYLHHSLLHIYDQIDVIVATSHFMERKHREMGLNRRFYCLSNFVDIEEYRPDFTPRPGPVIYFGRLSREKGIFTLMKSMEGTGAGLKVVGEGPLRSELEAWAIAKRAPIEFFGRLEGEELHREIRGSAVAVIPSEWYEPFGRTVIEAYALGKPVIGSRMGGIPELIKEGETGMTFSPGDIVDLREKLIRVLSDPPVAVAMGRSARALVQEHFGKEVYYRGLMSVYRQAMEGY